MLVLVFKCVPPMQCTANSKCVYIESYVNNKASTRIKKDGMLPVRRPGGGVVQRIFLIENIWTKPTLFFLFKKKIYKKLLDRLEG